MNPYRIVGDKAYLTLNRGKEAIVDVADLDRVLKHQWKATKNRELWYVYEYITQVKLHRFIIRAPLGQWVVFRDYNGFNCTKENLGIFGKVKRTVYKKRKVKIREDGLAREHPLFSTYGSMKARCRHKTHPDFKWYGARGIKCEFKSFWDFVDSVGPKPTPTHSIDRIDNNGNYNKKNCRWATPKEQRANRRDSEKYK